MAENNHFAQKQEIAMELLKFYNEPFPNGAEVIEWNGVDGGIAPDGTIVRTIS
jgi:hypothetical protein